MNEFELIRRYFQPAACAPWCQLGIGDDAAVIAPPAGQHLVLCTDTLIAGRHFPLNTAAADIGWKALAVNLSDLAAMGADALGFLLNLSLPSADAAFVEQFACGLFELAEAHQLSLIGGDTTQGPLSITITAFGAVPPGQALRRAGAQVGDVIAVAGNLGGAAWALQQGDQAAPALRLKLDRPEPLLGVGRALRGRARCAIDVSDGLAADLGHVLQAGAVGAVLDCANLPLHPALRGLPPMQARELALYGGDDYALCVCLPGPVLSQIQAEAELNLQPIGEIIAQPGLFQRGADGKLSAVETHGYQHFA